MKLSIIIPVLNEEDNLKILTDELISVLDVLKYEYEIIFINDGSTDKSWGILSRLGKEGSNIKLLNFSRNFGQTAAILAGFDNASGDILIPMDSDLQNDPREIPKLLDKLKEGFDVASGWRKDRKDKYLSRRLPSQIANWLISKITNVELHDYGCTLKAYRKEVIKNIRLYGEMHRFIPAYTAWHGAKITEIPVNHRARKYGKTKYNIARSFKVILDLLVVKFLSKYLDRPIHFFGKIGFWLIFFSFLFGSYSVYLKYFADKPFISTPMPLITIVCVIIGIQFILMGLLAEILIRIYYESNNKKNYSIKNKVNFN